MSTLNNRAISYSGADAQAAAASLEAAIDALDFPAEVVCVALASHEGMLHGVATVRLIEVADLEATTVAAAGGSEALQTAGIDDFDPAAIR